MGDNDFEEPELDALRRLLREARDKIEAYEAGADPTPVPEGVAGTTGQLWHKILQADEAGRFRLLNWLIELAERESNCFTQNHEGRIDHLQFELQDVQAKLGATLGFDTPQSLHSLTVAVQALRNVMVDGIAARESRVEYRELTDEDYPSDLLKNDEDFPQERTVQEKIGDQLKAAGIDTTAVCRYTWEGPSTDSCDGGVHECRLINPLHVESHQCDPDHCGQELSHDEAERLLEAGE